MEEEGRRLQGDQRGRAAVEGECCQREGTAVGQETLRQEVNAVVSDLERVYSRAAAKMGLSDSAFDILYTLHEHGDGCTQKELCELSYVGKQTVNSSVKRLAEQGILRLKPGHGRETHVMLTPRGRALLGEKITPLIKAEGEALNALSLEEQETLVRLLSRQRDALRAGLSAIGLQ